MAKPGQSNVKFVFGVEAINRKWELRKNTAAAAGSNKPKYRYFGSYTKYGATKNLGFIERNVFFVRKNSRGTMPTSLELNYRAAFSAVRQSVKVRLKNLSTLAADRAAFNAQKDQPGGKKSFYSYIWDLEWTAYETAHPFE